LAMARMKRALEAMVVEGIKTTIPLHLKIMDDPKFRAGDISTSFMEYFLSQNGARSSRNNNGVVAAAISACAIAVCHRDAYNNRLFYGEWTRLRG
jgi:Biotin carboxylase